MYAKFSIYNASLESEDRLINTDHIEEVLPHANVPVDPGAVETACCEFRFYSNTTIVVLLSFTEMATRLNALVGIIDQTGDIT